MARTNRTSDCGMRTGRLTDRIFEIPVCGSVFLLSRNMKNIFHSGDISKVSVCKAGQTRSPLEVGREDQSKQVILARKSRLL